MSLKSKNFTVRETSKLFSSNIFNKEFFEILKKKLEINFNRFKQIF